jgi:hypothetical protein
MVDTDRGPAYRDIEPFEKLVSQYYKLRAQQNLPAPTKPEALGGSIDEELRHIDVLPLESGAVVILRYLGIIPEEDVRRAFSGLMRTKPMGRREQLGAGDQGGKRQPLFPAEPALPSFPNITAIDGKAPTPEELAKAQRASVKQKLDTSTQYMYADCDESYRALYTQHLKSLFRQYIDQFTSPVAVTPQDDSYPIFLLSPEATPNERLSAALQILFTERLTPLATKRILETPEALFVKGCPADRADIWRTSVRSLPAFTGSGLPFAKDFEKYTRADLAKLVGAMKGAFDLCRPTTRWYFVLYGRWIGEKTVELRDRRPVSSSDAPLMAALNSDDRGARYRGIEQAMAAPQISQDIAGRLPAAISELFYDHCPAVAANEQLRSYRDEQEQKRKELEAWRAQRKK